MKLVASVRIELQLPQHKCKTTKNFDTSAYARAQMTAMSFCRKFAMYMALRMDRDKLLATHKFAVAESLSQTWCIQVLQLIKDLKAWLLSIALLKC